MSEIRAKLSEIDAAIPALKRIASRSIEIKPAYHIAKLIRLISDDWLDYERKRRDLVKEYGICIDEKSDTWQVMPENVTKFTDALKPLSDIEVTIPWGPFDLAWLPDIRPDDILALGPFVVFGEPNG